jgi:2-oxoglutarate/2-oxoacid ferredoxin oxidoreductase subunit beta
MPFDLAELAVAAGANYVARWTSYHVTELTKAVRDGIETPGFSFIEVRCQCPTSYGRRNKYRQPADFVQYLRESAILKNKWDRTALPGAEVPEDRFLVGEFVRRSRPVMGVPDET